MPVCEDSSIIPDSAFSSPPLATPRLVKRAGRTYGRPRHVEAAGNDSDTPLIHSAKSSGSRDSIYRTGPLDLNEEIPPSSDPAPSYSDVGRADDGDDNAGPDASPKYEFDWKRRLKEMDEQEDFDVDMAGVTHEGDASPSRVESGDKPALCPQRPEGRIEAHIPTSAVDGGIDALAEAVFDKSLNTLTASPSSRSSFRQSTSPQPAPNHRRIKCVIRDSDSEDGDNKDSSPTSPAFPHAITTPKLYSSPTPPTSDDDMFARSRRDLKGKAKAKALARPNVPPLRFSEEPTSASTAKPQKASSKDTRSKKRKIKAPTKKELAETARGRVRIAAEQQIAIPRAEGASTKYTIPRLFSSLCEAQLDPDPIVDFSSDPVTSPAHQYVAPSPPTLRQGDGLPLRQSPKRPRRSPLKAMVSLPELENESDTELPEVGTLVAQEKEKQDHAKRQQELLEAKKRAIAAQNAKAHSYDDDDDNDDLEIVQAPDMQMAIKEEDAERRSGRKKRLSEGRKRQLNLGGIGLSKQNAKESPARLDQTQVLRGTGSQKGKEHERLLTHAGLNKIMAAEAELQRQRVVKEKEEEWIRRGGKILSGNEGASSSVQEASKVYVEKGLNLPETRPTGMDVDLDEDNGSDDDWAPAGRIEERGSASPSPQPADSDDEDAGEGENHGLEDADITMVNEEDPTVATDDEDVEEQLPVNLPNRRSANRQIIDSDSEAENDENGVPARSRTTVGLRRFPTSPLATQDSNDEGAELRLLPRPALVSHRGSLSSADEPTEDEGDKENETSRMWDRGEDKENKAVVRHTVAGTKSPFGTRKSSLLDLDLESGPSRGHPTSPGLEILHTSADENDPGKGDEEKRRPFKNLLDDDPFLSPSRSTLPASFEARLKQASPAAPFPSTTTFSPAPFIGAKSLGFSQSPNDGSMRAPGPASLQPSFSDLFESGTEKQGASLKQPLGSLSASFSEPSPRNQLGRTSLTGDLGLTQDVTLQPAFQVSGNLLRKADQIFEKEQEFLLEAANKKPQKELELYVNDHGFLTQTRPDVASPDIYRPPSPTQGIAFNQPSELQSSTRRPLRTISLSDDVDFGPPAPLHRLRKRATTPTSPLLVAGYKSSPSPSPNTARRPANAFDELKRAAQARADGPKRKLERSEFIEQEAQESDDDEMFGFGRREKGNDDEEDGEDLDKTLETLVDDKEMDEKTIAAELVIEKYKEQEEADDLELERLHQAAVQGELRKKRRNRGFGMDDSDDDSDEDEANRKIRRGMHKKQKIDRDNIKELGEHQETKSFYDVYEGDLIAGNEDFMYLQDFQPQDVVMANQNEQDEDEEPRDAITTREVHRRIREFAQQPPDEGEEYPDLRDVSWMDQDHSDEENFRIKSVEFNIKKQPVTRRRGLDQEFDAGFEMPLLKPVIAEESISRMQSWAKVEGRSRHNGTTGRNVGGAAVTGHKAKSGGGSLRSSSAASSGSNAPSRPLEQRRPVKTQPSLLANVAAERRTTRFG